MTSSQGYMPLKPPYPPMTAAVGGVPTVHVDVPICAVLIFLYLGAAAGHMTLVQMNRRKSHRFILSSLMFGFCIARTVTCVLRIAWACRPTNVRLAVAATIFVNAGVLLLFIINLIFAQRIVRATHPHVGWSKAFHFAFVVLYALIGVMLVTIISVTVLSVYTLNANTHRIARDLQLTAITYILFIAFLPIPMVILGSILPRKTRLEKFGSGRWRTKVGFLLAVTAILTLGAAFRCGTVWKAPRPRSNPGWFDAKWCFYFFDFATEISVIYLYLIVRVDLRFHIPDGSKRAGDYSEQNNEVEEEKRRSSQSERRILSEEETFDDKIIDQSRRKDVEEGQLPTDH